MIFQGRPGPFMRALRAQYPARKQHSCIAAAKVRPDPEPMQIFAAGRCTPCGTETGSPELTPDTHRQRQLNASASRWPHNSVPAGHKRDSGNWAEWGVEVERVHGGGEGRGCPE